MSSTQSPIRLRPDVADALRDGRPVVALESTLIAHGLPRPQNLALAHELESIVRAEGGTPATVGVIGGEPVVGLNAEQTERIASGAEIPKLSVRDLAPAMACGADGATTVASTAWLASRVGVRVFATGGLGGVHREAQESFDESADLTTLSRTPMGVMCAGVKSILDVGATLERLESLSVTVVGYRTRRFPGFYLRDSGFEIDWSVESPSEAAHLLDATRLLHDAAVVIANPLPAEDQLDPRMHQRVLEGGLRAIRERGITGKAITPFLLDYFRTQTGGQSVEANLKIVRANARLAAQIARVASAR